MRYHAKKKRRRKKTPYEIQKARTWALCSQYNRRKMADKDGYVTCITCGTNRHWQDMIQAGHWLDGRGNAILFEDDGIYPQCFRCNYYGGGNNINVKENFHKFMEKTVGKKRMEELIRLKNTTKTFTIEELHDLQDEYEDKLVGIDLKWGS